MICICFTGSGHGSLAMKEGQNNMLLDKVSVVLCPLKLSWSLNMQQDNDTKHKSITGKPPNSILFSFFFIPTSHGNPTSFGSRFEQWLYIWKSFKVCRSMFESNNQKFQSDHWSLQITAAGFVSMHAPFTALSHLPALFFSRGLYHILEQKRRKGKSFRCVHFFFHWKKTWTKTTHLYTSANEENWKIPSTNCWWNCSQPWNYIIQPWLQKQKWRYRHFRGKSRCSRVDLSEIYKTMNDIYWINGSIYVSTLAWGNDSLKYVGSHDNRV